MEATRDRESQPEDMLAEDQGVEEDQGSLGADRVPGSGATTLLLHRVTPRHLEATHQQLRPDILMPIHTIPRNLPQ